MCFPADNTLKYARPIVHIHRGRPRRNAVVTGHRLQLSSSQLPSRRKSKVVQPLRAGPVCTLSSKGRLTSNFRSSLCNLGSTAAHCFLTVEEQDHHGSALRPGARKTRGRCSDIVGSSGAKFRQPCSKVARASSNDIDWAVRPLQAGGACCLRVRVLSGCPGCLAGTPTAHCLCAVWLSGWLGGCWLVAGGWLAGCWLAG